MAGQDGRVTGWASGSAGGAGRLRTGTRGRDGHLVSRRQGSASSKIAARAIVTVSVATSCPQAPSEG